MTYIAQPSLPFQASAPVAPTPKFYIGQIVYHVRDGLESVRPLEVVDWEYSVTGLTGPKMKYKCKPLGAKQTTSLVVQEVDLYDKAENAMDTLIARLQSKRKPCKTNHSIPELRAALSRCA